MGSGTPAGKTKSMISTCFKVTKLKVRLLVQILQTGHGLPLTTHASPCLCQAALVSPEGSWQGRDASSRQPREQLWSEPSAEQDTLQHQPEQKAHLWQMHQC